MGLTVSENIAKTVVTRFRLSCFVVVTPIVLIILAVNMLELLEVGEMDQNDWSVSDSLPSQYADALSAARELLNVKALVGDSEAVERGEQAGWVSTNYVYQWADGRDADLFTPANLQIMCRLEAFVVNHTDYPDFCVLDAATKTCKPQALTPVSYFYSGDASRCEELDAVAFATKRDYAYGLVSGSVPRLTQEQDLLALAFAFSLDKDFAPDNLQVVRSRSQLALGGPLANYTKIIDDDTSEQYALYKAFALDVEAKLSDAFGLQASFGKSRYYERSVQVGELEIRFQNLVWRQEEFLRALETDFLFASGSMVFVWVCMLLHTKSFWVSNMGILSIMVSFPVALFWYRFVLGIDYFKDIHIVAIFVILGIGADDIFVVFDAYKQSLTGWRLVRDVADAEEAATANHYGTADSDQEVLIARLAYTYKRSAASVFNTSFTTIVAFLATAVSPITPVAGFGFFAAICVGVNYLWVLVLQPLVICVYHWRFEASSPDPDDYAHSPEEKLFVHGYVPLMLAGAAPLSTGLDGPLVVKTEDGKAGGSVRNGRPLFPVALASFALLLVLFGVLATKASQLETPQEQDEPFREEHMFTGFYDLLQTGFLGAVDESFVTVEVAYGIEGIDRSGFERFKPSENRGTAVFDAAFSLAANTTQRFILSECERLLELDCADAAGRQLDGCQSASTFSSLKLVQSVDCTLRDFHEAFNDTDLFALGESDPAQFYALLRQFVVADPQRYGERVGFVEGELKFFVVEYTINMIVFLPVKRKEPVLALTTQYLEAARKRAPATCASMIDYTFDKVWMETELGIVQGMFSGMLISFPVAYAVLLFSTRNLVVATSAVLAIVAIVVNVLGVIQLLGWALGVGEAIAAVMVIGLAIDYSVHLGHMYNHAGEEGIEHFVDRFRYSAEKMGGTTLAGAITTGGSAAVMFLCQLAFFTKMSYLICFTVLFSIIYALFFFMAGLLLYGPSGRGGGDLGRLCDRR